MQWNAAKPNDERCRNEARAFWCHFSPDTRAIQAGARAEKEPA